MPAISFEFNGKATILLFKRNSIHTHIAHILSLFFFRNTGSFSSSHKEASKRNILPALVHNAKSIFIRNILHLRMEFVLVRTKPPARTLILLSLSLSLSSALPKDAIFMLCNVYHHHHTNKLSGGFLNRP